jgi:NAD(P)-dependent dehydrogenase (short-subunit alcohol dehydrogenase family)
MWNKIEEGRKFGEMKLSGRTCIFKGASGGDGVSAAKALCAGGMNVVMMTHQLEQAQKLVDEISNAQYTGRCVAVLDGDCQNPPKTDEQIYKEIFDEFGSLDVIICNTGGDGKEDSIDTVSKEQLMRDVEHLLGSSYVMLKTALPYLRQSKAPRVIFMTTVEGVRGGKLENFSNAVAKGAVWSLTKNCAARLMSEGITVNCIEKGAIERLEKEKHGFNDTSHMLPYIPAGRMGTPDDLAGAICFLASEETSYMTGATLDLSGGLSLV